MDLMGGLCSVDEELIGWSHPEGSGQQLNVQMGISDKWCPSGVHTWEWCCLVSSSMT